MIVSHGYIDPRTYVTDDSSYAQFIAAFARAGYLVLKPDFRGHGKSQGVAEGGYLSPVYTYDLLNLVSTLDGGPARRPHAASACSATASAATRRCAPW